MPIELTNTRQFDVKNIRKIATIICGIHAIVILLELALPSALQVNFVAWEALFLAINGAILLSVSASIRCPQCVFLMVLTVMTVIRVSWSWFFADTATHTAHYTSFMLYLPILAFLSAGSRPLASKVAFALIAAASVLIAVSIALDVLATNTTFHDTRFALAPVGGYLIYGLIMHNFTHRNSELTMQSSQDPLTGLSNRRGLELALLAWPEGEQRSMIVVDIDHFKQINDKLGHEGGDQILIAFAAAVREFFEDYDGAQCFRLGGEEFLIILPGIRTEHEVMSVADTLRLAVSGKEFRTRSLVSNMTVSAGCGICPGPKDFRESLREFDQRLYAAKRRGRNRVIGGSADRAAVAVA